MPWLFASQRQTTDNQRTIDALEREMQKIDDGIAMRMAEINGMSATPTRSNRSPTDK